MLPHAIRADQRSGDMIKNRLRGGASKDAAPYRICCRRQDDTEGGFAQDDTKGDTIKNNPRERMLASGLGLYGIVIMG